MQHKTLKIQKNHFEHLAWNEKLFVCGLDEVGRGCLAGPVVVAAVILPHNTTYRLLKDSKILEPEDRVTAYNWITKNCYWSVGYASHQTIDAINIYQATLFAMRKAYLQLTETLPFPIQQLKYIVIDAMPLNLDTTFGHEGLTFHHFTQGERFSTSIAAASIVAKVTRDRLMERISTFFPAFAFEQHKGYATKQHVSALLAQGPTIIHRSSFISEIKPREASETNLQQTLFGVEP